MSSPFLQPPLMVIGDSLPQGCRSLSVDRKFCSESYPAKLARLAGIAFAPPQHPRPILGNLETVLAEPIGAGLGAVFGGVNANYRDWRASFRAAPAAPAQAPVFDNLAVAGTTIEDILGLDASPLGDPPVGTPALAERYFANFTSLNLLNAAHRAAAANLHLAVNARYVLNPANDPARQGFSMADWVRLRQPQNLLVHTGHNNGLYRVGSKGLTDAWNAQWTGAAPALARYEELLDRLDSDLPDTRVMILGLPKLSAVSNLMPDLDEGPSRDYPGYWASYWTSFGTPVRVEVATVQAVDARILQINRRLENLTRSTAKRRRLWSFFDTFAFFDRNDAKHHGPKFALRLGGLEITNNYIHGRHQREPGPPSQGVRYTWKFESGGFQSVDGMHPTGIGYSLLACELAEWLTGSPLSQAARNRELLAAFKAERLVQNFPQGLSTFVRKVRKAGQGLPEHPRDLGLLGLAGMMR